MLIKMRKIFLCVSFSLFIIQCFGQVYDPYFRQKTSKVPVDTCRYAVNYRHTFYKDTVTQTRFHDLHCLEIGSQISKYYSLNGAKVDSTWAVAEKQMNPFKDMAKDVQINYEDYYFNYPSKGTLMVSSGVINREYVYQEPVPRMEWHLLQEKTEILGYECIKAVTVFRGREYHVWFTQEIPISSGPWKFNGLPGLILKAQDSEELFTWTATAILRPTNRILYKLDGLRTQQCSRTDYLKLQKMSWQDPILLYQTLGQRVNVTLKNPDGTKRPAGPGEWKRPYIPARELE
jgi:GLPGLI family protein